MARETTQEAMLRWQKLHLLQDHYDRFLPFLVDVMELLGFSLSEVQEDIAQYIAYGPHYLMVQAQRGQAKTTIAAAYCVWVLIHDPRHRVLIVSAGGKQANDIATLVIRIINNMPILECMRPDVMNGDRSSVEHFDVHYTLKGVDKSPSVKCLGITANLQGNRADTILADDVESKKNANTATMRAQLLELTLDFTSICSTGRIIWLGTPQSQDSIYNTLPGRGVSVRIWPGRYPTQAQMSYYGENLAPLLLRRIAADPGLQAGGGMDGQQGRAVEKEGTGWLDEGNLQAKEMDQGASWFQLQHMLCTTLQDQLRFPLKPQQLVLMDVTDRAPVTFTRGMDISKLVERRSHGFGFRLKAPHDLSPEAAPFVGICAYIDPAGGGKNADETAYAVTALLNANVYLLEVGGLPGGYSIEVLTELAQRLAKWKPNVTVIEKNMGFGAFREVFTPVLHREHQCQIDDDLVTGQKELRIINTLEPILGRGSFVITENALEVDTRDAGRYPAKDRNSYSFIFQLAKITRERGALIHDDRVDAVEGAVRYWQPYLAIKEEDEVKRARERAYNEMVSDPLGHHRHDPPVKRGSILARRYR